MVKSLENPLLTAKQMAFCHEFVVDKNGTQAATRAGYSARTANEQSTRLLANVHVNEQIQRLMEEKRNITGWCAARVIAEYEDIIRLAKADGQYAPAVVALSKITELCGIEPIKNADTNYNGSIQVIERRIIDPLMIEHVVSSDDQS